AEEGYTGATKGHSLQLTFGGTLLEAIPEGDRETVIRLLECDPRTSYVDDPERVWGMSYASYNIKFKVTDSQIEILAVSGDSQG
ncbi:MAG: hypothetical protein HUJ91_03190, partial [Bacteroidales bacterium]|nr:hypothetical protein [Bacteroidales bacterium]